MLDRDGGDENARRWDEGVCPEVRSCEGTILCADILPSSEFTIDGETGHFEREHKEQEEMDRGDEMVVSRTGGSQDGGSSSTRVSVSVLGVVGLTVVKGSER